MNIDVNTAWNNDKQEKMMIQLGKLYQIADIASNLAKLYIVKNFTVLPYLPLTHSDAVAALGLSRDQENELYDLADVGWLQQFDNGLHPDLATSYNNLSIIYNVLGDDEKRKFFSEKAIEVQRKIDERNQRQEE